MEVGTWERDPVDRIELTQFMKDAGVLAVELATELAIDTARLSRILNGRERKTPDAEWFKKASQAVRTIHRERARKIGEATLDEQDSEVGAGRAG